MQTLLLLSFAACLYAQVPQPAPSPRVLARSQKEKATQNQTKTNSTAATDQNTNSSKIRETTANSDPPDWANWCVAAFTFALAIVAVLQWRTLSKQAKYMKYTLRPKLKIRNVEIIDGIESLLRGEPLKDAGTFQIYNSGGSEAHVSGIACKLFALDKLPMKAPFPAPDESANENIILPPGVYGTRSFPFDAVDYEKFKGIRQKQIGLYIMGEVAYRDDLGLRRVTRFCRRFDWEKERFLPISDPDYEGDDY